LDLCHRMCTHLLGQAIHRKLPWNGAGSNCSSSSSNSIL
jgi:hypothetical protein